MKIFLSVIPSFSYLGIFCVVNDTKLHPDTKINVKNDNAIRSQYPLIFSEAFTSFISLHINGIEEEMNELRASIIKNDSLPDEYVNLLSDKKSSIFDGYFLSYMFLRSEYALHKNVEFTAELFSYWINTPESKRNHFWKLVDFFYVNVAPNIIGIDDKTKLKEIVNNTSNIEGLSIDLGYENNNQESFIDLFPKSENLVNYIMSDVISISVKTWSLEDSMQYYLNQYSDSYFPLNSNDNEWVESSLIKKLSTKLNRMLTTRIDDESAMTAVNTKYSDFKTLDDDLRKSSVYKKDGQEDRYGIDLSNAIRSGINLNNDSWNKHQAEEYFFLNKELEKIEKKLLKVFNYFFYLYSEFYPNNNNYLHIIKNINVAYGGKETKGTTWRFDTDNLYGFVMGIWPSAWNRASKITDILEYESSAFENTFVHEFGHVVEMFIDSFDFINGNERLISLHKNTLEHTFENVDNLKNYRLEELDAPSVDNKRIDEIVAYKNLDTPTIYMNEDNIENLYYEIRKQIDSYIQWYSNDKWGVGKDLKNILENIDIYYGDKHLDEAVGEIMSSYNNGENKEFELKISSLYEFKNDTDLTFNVVNTKKPFKQLNELNLDDLSVNITENKNESIELITNAINNNLNNVIGNAAWKVVYDGKFYDLKDLDFNENNFNNLNIIVTGVNESEYQGYTFFKINTTMKKNIFELVKDTDLGDVSSINQYYLLNKISEKYPELTGVINVDSNIDGKITITPKEHSDYFGTVVFTYNYVEDDNSNGNTTEKNSVNYNTIILGAIIGIVAIFVILIIRMLIKQRKNKGK